MSLRRRKTSLVKAPLETPRHLLWLHRALLVGSVLLIAAAAGAVCFMPSADRINLLPRNEQGFERELALENIFTYNNDIKLSSSTTMHGRSLRVSIDDQERYTGFGIARDLKLMPNTVMRMRWRGRGKPDYVAFEVQAELPDTLETATWVKMIDAPTTDWSVVEVPLTELKWHKIVNPKDADPQPLNYAMVRGMEMTFPPGPAFEIEVTDIECVTPNHKWSAVTGLAFLSFVLFGLRKVSWLILDRDWAKASLRDSEVRYESIYNATGEGIVLLNPKGGTILEFNRAVCRLLDCPAEALKEGDSPIAEPIQQIICEEARAFEWEGRTATGQPFWAEFNVFQLETAAGPRLVTVIRDITERKRAEKEKKLLESQLLQSQKMEALGRLAGGVAHDFNNLLTGILCSCELAADQPAIDSQTRELLRQIEQFVKMAEGLTRQMLAFSRRQPVQQRPVAASVLVRKMLELITRVIGEDIHLEFISEASRDHVLADAGQFEQILLNLAVNARDAMPEGGSLLIHLDNVDVMDELLPPLQPGAYLRLRISDTGPGIPEELRSHIFEPFFTTKEVGKGTGLGLATTYGIVQQHRGRIDVECLPGQGARFTILLPLVEAPAAAVRVIEPTAEAVQGSETILVVEDNIGVRKLVVVVLEKQGYKVIAAENPAAADPLFAEHASEINLLLSDVVMPGESGPSFYLRVREKHPELKVLFISGYTDLPGNTSTEIDPAWPLLMKPFSPDDLCREIRRVLEESKEAAIH